MMEMEENDVGVVDDKKVESKESCWKKLREWLSDKWVYSEGFRALVMTIVALIVIFTLTTIMKRGVVLTESNPQIILNRHGWMAFKSLSDEPLDVQLVSYERFTVKILPQRYEVVDRMNSERMYVSIIRVQPGEVFKLLDTNKEEVRVNIDGEDITYRLEYALFWWILFILVVDGTCLLCILIVFRKWY